MDSHLRRPRKVAFYFDGGKRRYLPRDLVYVKRDRWDTANFLQCPSGGFFAGSKIGSIGAVAISGRREYS